MNDLKHMTTNQLTYWHKYWSTEMDAAVSLREAYEIDIAEIPNSSYDVNAVNLRFQNAALQFQRYSVEIARRLPI